MPVCVLCVILPTALDSVLFERGLFKNSCLHHLSRLQHLLFGSLGRSLACADPPESERLPILNEAWKVITKVRNPQVRATVYTGFIIILIQ